MQCRFSCLNFIGCGKFLDRSICTGSNRRRPLVSIFPQHFHTFSEQFQMVSNYHNDASNNAITKPGFQLNLSAAISVIVYHFERTIRHKLKLYNFSKLSSSKHLAQIVLIKISNVPTVHIFMGLSRNFGQIIPPGKNPGSAPFQLLFPIMKHLCEWGHENLFNCNYGSKYNLSFYVHINFSKQLWWQCK